MRDFSNDHRWLSLNTATLRKQGDFAQIIDACARHGIRAIDPWREQVASMGLDRAARAIRDAGLDLSGYCRGGLFPSDASRRAEVRDDNRRCIDEAKALGASCIVLVAGGLPQYARPGSHPSKDIAAVRGAGRGGARRDARLCERGQGAARDRAAASGLCRRPLLRQHRRNRRSISATGSIPAAAACSASRSTSITSGGIRTSWARSRAPAGIACLRSMSATGWCRPRTSSTTAA